MTKGAGLSGHALTLSSVLQGSGSLFEIIGLLNLLVLLVPRGAKLDRRKHLSQSVSNAVQDWIGVRTIEGQAVIALSHVGLGSWSERCHRERPQKHG